MATLSHRERALKALDHEETDRVPIDIGGAGPTSIHVTPYTGLLKLLGLEEAGQAQEEGEWAATHAMATPAERVLKRLDVDFRGVHLGSPDLIPTEWLDRNNYRDEWGVVWTRTAGNYFINTKGPFQEREPTLGDLKRHRWPVPGDPGRVKGLRQELERLRQETGCALVLNLPYCILRECQRMRGFAESMADLMLNPALAHAMMERVLEVSAGVAVAALGEVGDLVDVVLFPEDMGTQEQCYMRPKLYREMVKPYHRRLVEAIKSKTDAKVLLHSDGAVYEIIGDFIDIGVEALNPIQVSARGMGDTRKLKAEFGRDLCFWGAIDTHRVLPFGTPGEVAAEVRTRIDHLAPGGGYVLASVHTINAEVPPANVAAMLETARAYRLRS